MTINSIIAWIWYAEIDVTSKVVGGTSNLTHIPTVRVEAGARVNDIKSLL